MRFFYSRCDDASAMYADAFFFDAKARRRYMPARFFYIEAMTRRRF